VLIAKTLKSKVCTPVQFSYWLYRPARPKRHHSWPLVVFLHGAGERGNDLNSVKRHGPLKLVEQGENFPFLIAAPQCPQNDWWFTSELDAWLSELLKQLPVDEKRIYLTGLSMGGFATWYWAIEHPERFAAIAPVCGGGEPFLVERIKDVPVWAFHGADDNVVPLRRTLEMVDALKKVGKNVRFTVYENTGHDSWTKAYNTPELYEWLLMQNK